MKNKVSRETILCEKKKRCKIVVDPGSGHSGELEKAIDIISMSKEVGADAVKFQLFTDLPPNKPLPYEMMPTLTEFGNHIGIEVFASVWDRKGLDTLIKCGCKSVKFAYSQRNSDLIEPAIKSFENVYVSFFYYESQMADLKKMGTAAIKFLLCVPTYPNFFIVKFDSVFPERFFGFSDHSLGVTDSVLAIQSGARLIEKHVKFDCKIFSSENPDSFHSIDYNDLSTLVQYCNTNY
jgi:sialic acid synthase SpsE